jgi:hypothetical protein
MSWKVFSHSSPSPYLYSVGSVLSAQDVFLLEVIATALTEKRLETQIFFEVSDPTR